MDGWMERIQKIITWTWKQKRHPSSHTQAQERKIYIKKTAKAGKLQKRQHVYKSAVKRQKSKLDVFDGWAVLLQHSWSCVWFVHKKKGNKPTSITSVAISKESPPKYCAETHTSFLGEGGGLTAAAAARSIIKNEEVDGARKEKRMDGGGLT